MFRLLETSTWTPLQYYLTFVVCGDESVLLRGAAAVGLTRLVKQWPDTVAEAWTEAVLPLMHDSASSDKAKDLIDDLIDFTAHSVLRKRGDGLENTGVQKGWRRPITESKNGCAFHCVTRLDYGKALAGTWSARNEIS